MRTVNSEANGWVKTNIKHIHSDAECRPSFWAWRWLQLWKWKMILDRGHKPERIFYKVKAELGDRVIRFRRFRRITHKTALSHRQGFQLQGRTFNGSSLCKFLWGSRRTLTVCPHLQCSFTSSVHLSVTPTTHRGSRPTSFLKYWELMVLQISKHHLCCTPFLDTPPHFLASLQPVIIVAMLQYFSDLNFCLPERNVIRADRQGSKNCRKKGADIAGNFPFNTHHHRDDVAGTLIKLPITDSDIYPLVHPLLWKNWLLLEECHYPALWLDKTHHFLPIHQMISHRPPKKASIKTSGGRRAFSPRENFRAVRVLELWERSCGTVALKTHRDDGSSPWGASS